jgi:hypothetical protein
MTRKEPTVAIEMTIEEQIADLKQQYAFKVKQVDTAKEANNHHLADIFGAQLDDIEREIDQLVGSKDWTLHTD